MPQNSKEIIPRSDGITKPPRSILPGIFAFAPNRDTLGATAYFIVNKSGNILLDCPAWNETNQKFVNERGVRWLAISHRGSLSKRISQIQEALYCEIIIQEQEAYLLSEVKVTTFSEKLALTHEIELIWTPGHSPGASCLYWQDHGGVLFCGRHLLPDSSGEIVPLRTAKTFHWYRQLRSVQKLRDRFTPDTLSYICPGANTGFLRGKGYVDRAYQRLAAIDLDALRTVEAWI
ncbi:MBL fold metallo-hydrolase [Pleurocapsales cyanobacterium LEGE 06147]|nr:MBL fold metallo-hydrolase [Pleurocapsales cyanobacterium LEGE 06147]